MLRRAAIFAALAATCATVARASSGFATGLSDSGINEFKNAILPLINAELAAFSVSDEIVQVALATCSFCYTIQSLPDISVPDLDTPIGHVTLSLSNIKVNLWRFCFATKHTQFPRCYSGYWLGYYISRCEFGGTKHTLCIYRGT